MHKDTGFKTFFLSLALKEIELFITVTIVVVSGKRVIFKI